MEEKIIGGHPISVWKKAFSEVVLLAIDKDYFSDILFFELYPNTHEQTATIENEEKICDIYNEKWNFVNEAFEEVFGFSRFED